MTYFHEISWVGRGTPKLHLQQIRSSGPSLRKDAVHFSFLSVMSSPLTACGGRPSPGAQTSTATALLRR